MELHHVHSSVDALKGYTIHTSRLDALNRGIGCSFSNASADTYAPL